MRPDILSFAEKMEDAMSRHDIIKADSWKYIDEQYLWNKLYEEFEEAITSQFPADELVDLANICMMLYHRVSESGALDKDLLEQIEGGQRDDVEIRDFEELAKELGI